MSTDDCCEWMHSMQVVSPPDLRELSAPGLLLAARAAAARTSPGGEGAGRTICASLEVRFLNQDPGVTP